MLRDFAGITFLFIALSLFSAGLKADIVPAEPAPTAPLTYGGEQTFVATTLPASTVVTLQTIDIVSSKTSKPGDTFRLRIAEPVMSGDMVLIPADTPVIGEVVHAARSGIGGKAGELILAARYIDAPQGRMRLRSSFSAAGKDTTGAALAVAMVTAGLGIIIKGKEMELPAGTMLSARLAADTTIMPMH